MWSDVCSVSFMHLAPSPINKDPLDIDKLKDITNKVIILRGTFNMNATGFGMKSLVAIENVTLPI